MDEIATRYIKADGSLQLPVALLTCNFMPPSAEHPSCLTHDDMTTLFHEFGHTFHHLSSQVDYSGVSGINGVAWDAVELPSQFMENFCWEFEVLQNLSEHTETGNSLPKALFDKLERTRTFGTGMQMLRQVEFALFDFKLYSQKAPDTIEAVQALAEAVRQDVAVMHPPHYNRSTHNFTHIFSGGYAAGYYSYKWAEVLSADAYGRFQEDGIFNAATGAAFLHDILEKGGSAEPMELFKTFRGREPEVEALLKQDGIV
jgi:oligopeptidase A